MREIVRERGTDDALARHSGDIPANRIAPTHGRGWCHGARLAPGGLRRRRAGDGIYGVDRGGRLADNGGSSSTATATAAAPGSASDTIHFYTWTAAANLPAWKQAVTAFQQKYPSINVTLDYTPGQQYWDKLTVEYAGGTTPDVIYASPANAQDVATKGMVLDLSSYIAQDKFNIADIDPRASQQPYQWRQSMGPLRFTDTRYTIYNKTMFKQPACPTCPDLGRRTSR